MVQLPRSFFFRIVCVAALRWLLGTMSDEMQCVNTSDPLTDFFETHGLGKCREAICNFVGIETAADLAILTESDVQGSRFREWATLNLSIVQHRKVLIAFASGQH